MGSTNANSGSRTRSGSCCSVCAQSSRHAASSSAGSCGNSQTVNRMVRCYGPGTAASAAGADIFVSKSDIDPPGGFTPGRFLLHAWPMGVLKPRSSPIEVLFVIVPHALLLDIAGPAEAFRLANLRYSDRGL